MGDTDGVHTGEEAAAGSHRDRSEVHLAGTTQSKPLLDDEYGRRIRVDSAKTKDTGIGLDEVGETARGRSGGKGIVSHLLVATPGVVPVRVVLAAALAAILAFLLAKPSAQLEVDVVRDTTSGDGSRSGNGRDGTGRGGG